MSAFKVLLETKDKDVQPEIEALVDKVITKGSYAVTRDERARLIEEMVHDVTGFGPLEPLLADPSITEVMVNGPDHIYIERRGKIHRVDSVFLNDQHVLRVIDRIITPLGRRIDETARGSTLACQTAPASTRSSSRSRWSVRSSPSASSRRRRTRSPT